MKKIFTSIIILLSFTHAGLFGETEEEKRNSKEKLRLAMSLEQNPLIKKIRKENKYYKKILKEHKINYKSVIEQKKRANNINDIKNYFLVSEKKEIETLEQINKELLRLLEVNYIPYKKQNRNYKTEMEIFKETYKRRFSRKPIIREKIIIKEKNNKDIERIKAKENLKLQMKQAILDVN